MKIDNYNVMTQASHFNVEFSKTEVKATSNATTSSNDTAGALSAIELNEKELKENNSTLAKELSKAVLKNINNETRKVMGDRVEITTTYVEAESLSFNLDAVVKTNDKEINISLDVNLSRSFMQTLNISLESLANAAAFKDPLILSLDGGFPSLDFKTFSFDIDSDGKSDQISLLNKNSGFLALDKNENGIIDNGNELFGTKSGDGFGDLAKYDEDNNGWIDENDAIFDKLQVWQKSEGKDTLIGLGEVGIGAIFLGDSATPFIMKSDTNVTLAQMKSSSMFLYEDGRAGLISQIDFAIDPSTDESLENFKDINETRKLLMFNDMYNNDASLSNGEDANVEKLQQKLTALQNKLNSANDEQKASINAQIASINTQMMALIST